MLEKLDDFFVRIVGLIQSVDNDEYRGRQIIQESVELTVKCIQGRLRVPVHVVFVKAEERGQALGAKVSELAEQRRQQSAQATRSGGVCCIIEVVEDQILRVSPCTGDTQIVDRAGAGDLMSR